MNELLAFVDGYGFICPQRTEYEFESAPPLRHGDEARIIVQGRRLHVKYVIGETGSAGMRGWLVKVREC